MTQYSSVPNLVVGGKGPNGYQYIGKISHKGRMILSRIEGTTFNVIKDGNESFSILVYRDKCYHYNNKCINRFSVKPCDCLECADVKYE